MKVRIREAGRRLLDPLALGLLALRITPNQITMTGLVLSFAAGAALAGGRYLVAAGLLLAGSLCDVLDGSLARRSGKSTRFGAFLDSTVDRYAEMALFLGLAVYFTRRTDSLYVAVVFVATAGSLLVSYTRARAEGLGLECKVGLMERPERLALLILAAVVGPIGMKVALWILATLTHFTALQRVLHVRFLLSGGAGGPGDAGSREA